jgi:hypothetical protein
MTRFRLMAGTGKAVLASLVILGIASSAAIAQIIVINEVVTDPQHDWDDTAGGNGTPFDNVPGNGTISTADEWIEIHNHDSVPIDLTGWTVEFIDTTPATLDFANPVGVVLVFSGGGSVTNFQPGEYLTVGNPPGSMNNTVYVVLRDAAVYLVDDVEIGDDPEGDGLGDGAPDGTGSDGNATGPEDESIARFPDSIDTDDDVADFRKQAATIGGSNGTATAVEPPPEALRLLGAAPNPFNPHTAVAFSVDRPQKVCITVYDMAGHRVSVLTNQMYSAGSHAIDWDGRDATGRSVSSGTYLVRMESAGRAESKKVMLVR